MASQSGTENASSLKTVGRGCGRADSRIRGEREFTAVRVGRSSVVDARLRSNIVEKEVANLIWKGTAYVAHERSNRHRGRKSGKLLELRSAQIRVQKFICVGIGRQIHEATDPTNIFGTYFAFSVLDQVHCRYGQRCGLKPVGRVHEIQLPFVPRRGDSGKLRRIAQILHSIRPEPQERVTRAGKVSRTVGPNCNHIIGENREAGIRERCGKGRFPGAMPAGDENSLIPDGNRAGVKTQYAVYSEQKAKDRANQVRLLEAAGEGTKMADHFSPPFPLQRSSQNGPRRQGFASPRPTTARP
jgi:hypothetical protein